MKNQNKKSHEHDWLNSLGWWIKSRFNLEDDQAAEAEVAEYIGKGVDFKGVNMWILIFATFIASLGLNVNSAAVIIGAMLISPLMGPIMGIGFSLGINDFDLMKRSLRNFLFMVLVSFVTSTLYFWISPISTAQSELLARTTPTIYDVMIAFFGGSAGIIAQTRKERGASIVIPGVAIATALMPPLCTAGYGMATGQFAYLVGAFYLFFINTIFIALATYLMVRFLHYRKKTILDPARARRVNRTMVLIVVATLIPSVFMAIHIVQKSLFESNADRYVHAVFQFQNTQVIDFEKIYEKRKQPSQIQLLLIGEALSPDVIENARVQLSNYGLHNTELIVRQPGERSEKLDFSTINTNYSLLLEEKNRQIAHLEKRLSRYNFDTLSVEGMVREAGVVFDNIASVSINRSISYGTEGKPVDTTLICMVRPKNQKKTVDQKKLAEWLKIRTNAPKVLIYIRKEEEK